MDTISTSDPEKLPETVRGLLDETRPIPPGVSFFEQHFTPALFLKRLVLSVVLFLISVVLIIYSLDFLWENGRHIDPKYRQYIDLKALVAGAVFVCGGWWVFASAFKSRALGRRQTAGERLRYGIFLTPEALVHHNQFDTTVIPRENFRGLDGNSVKYLAKNEPKSFALPGEWFGASPAQVTQAITTWGQMASLPPAAPAAS